MWHNVSLNVSFIITQGVRFKTIFSWSEMHLGSMNTSKRMRPISSSLDKTSLVDEKIILSHKLFPSLPFVE